DYFSIAKPLHDAFSPVGNINYGLKAEKPCSSLERMHAAKYFIENIFIIALYFQFDKHGIDSFKRFRGFDNELAYYFIHFVSHDHPPAFKDFFFSAIFSSFSLSISAVNGLTT